MKTTLNQSRLLDRLEVLENRRQDLIEARETLEVRKAEEDQMRAEAGPDAVWDVAPAYGMGNFETHVTLAGYRVESAKENLLRAEEEVAASLLALLARDQEVVDEATARSIWDATHKHNWVAPRREKPRKDAYGKWRIECRCHNLDEEKVVVNGKPFWFYCQGTRRFEAPTEAGPWKASFGQ